MSALAPGLQAFFTDRLIGQRAAIPNTIGAYKTSLRLLLGFAAQRTAKAPAALDIAELDAPLIAAFLDHLEADRHNSVGTRNNRLATPCSPTWPCATPSTPHPSNGCSPSRPSGLNATWSPT